MASALGNFMNQFLAGDDTFTSDTSDPDGYLPPNTDNKRKARAELRPDSHPRRPSFASDDYENANFLAHAAERRTSKAGYLVLDSGVDSEVGGEPPRRFSVFNQRRPVRRQSVGKSASPERVRAGRLKKFMSSVTSTWGDIAHGLQGVINGTVESSLDGDGSAERPENDIEEAQSQQQADEEHQPSESDGEAQVRTAPSAPAPRRSSSEAQWINRPNARARHIVRHTPSLSAAASQIKKELGEPEYAYRDIEIRDAMWQIMDKMERLARQHFSYDMPRNKRHLETTVFSRLEPETVRIIGSVASGGPGGEDGWRELFWDDQKRRALVCAIIGNVLVEQVFQHPCFGADELLLRELSGIQEDMQDEDGFARNTAYASHLRKHLLTPTLDLPLAFHLHLSTLLHTLLTHLTPLLPPGTPSSSLSSPLTALLMPAALLALHMRLDPHTVYYHPPLFKDMPFESAYMDAFNKSAMLASNPRNSDTVFPPGTLEMEKRRARSDEPLVQIALMAGVTAYRKGGWETSKSGVWRPVYKGAEKGDAERGIRARVLVHGWVYCRWGRQRRFGEEGGKEGRRVHGVAWKEPGFVEFRRLWMG